MQLASVALAARRLILLPRFSLGYAKFDSMTYVVPYKNGRLVREGGGLVFLGATLGSAIAAVPQGRQPTWRGWCRRVREHQTQKANES